METEDINVPLNGLVHHGVWVGHRCRLGGMACHCESVRVNDRFNDGFNVGSNVRVDDGFNFNDGFNVGFRVGLLSESLLALELSR